MTSSLGDALPRFVGGIVSDKGSTFTVAASDSSSEFKAMANFVCDGTADQVEIQRALDSLPTIGGMVLLLPGTYTCSGSVNIPRNNVTLTGLVHAYGYDEVYANTTTLLFTAGGAQANIRTGTHTGPGNEIDTLNDTAANFSTSGVRCGDLITNTTKSTTGRVNVVDSTTAITTRMSANDWDISDAYTIDRASVGIDLLTGINSLTDVRLNCIIKDLRINCSGVDYGIRFGLRTLLENVTINGATVAGAIGQNVIASHISRCTFVSNTGIGLWISGGRIYSVRDCNLRTNGRQGCLIEGAQGAIFEGCIFESNDRYGVELFKIYPAINLDYVTFLNCYWENNSRDLTANTLYQVFSSSNLNDANPLLTGPNYVTFDTCIFNPGAGGAGVAGTRFLNVQASRFWTFRNCTFSGSANDGQRNGIVLGTNSVATRFEDNNGGRIPTTGVTPYVVTTNGVGGGQRIQDSNNVTSNSLRQVTLWFGVSNITAGASLVAMSSMATQMAALGASFNTNTYVMTSAARLVSIAISRRAALTAGSITVEPFYKASWGAGTPGASTFTSVAGIQTGSHTGGAGATTLTDSAQNFTFIGQAPRIGDTLVRTSGAGFPVSGEIRGITATTLQARQTNNATVDFNNAETYRVDHPPSLSINFAVDASGTSKTFEYNFNVFTIPLGQELGCFISASAAYLAGGVHDTLVGITVEY